MKTLKTLMLAGAGLLLAGAANAQVSAPVVAPASTTNYSSLTPRSANNAITPFNTTRNGGQFYYESSVVQQLGTGQYASVIQAGRGGMTADIQQNADATRADAYQEQTGNPGAYGLNDHAYISQSGGSNGIASQRQAGDANNAVIRQTQGDFNLAFQHQIGNGNNAEINQDGTPAGHNFANQVQVGSDNQARTTQVYGANFSSTYQNGTSNTALVSQR